MPTGRQQIQHARRDVVLDRLEVNALLGIEGREVVEEDLVARLVGGFEVDGFDLDEREIALTLFGRADLAGDRVAGAQIELADLGRRDVDIVRPRQVVVVRGAEESKAVGKAFEHALGEDQAVLLGLRLQDLEDQFLLAQAGGPTTARSFATWVSVVMFISFSLPISRTSPSFSSSIFSS